MKGFFKFGSPVIELAVQGREMQMLLDTGFNGCLMLPRSVIEELGLEQIGFSDYSTASGENVVTEIYMTRIILLDEEREVMALSTGINVALAGMELFDDCRIIIERSKNIVEITKSV